MIERAWERGQLRITAAAALAFVLLACEKPSPPSAEGLRKALSAFR